MRLYKLVSLFLFAVFTLVGLLFLFFPEGVLAFFNALSTSLDMPTIPLEGLGFYPLLAVGYMYLVSLLAFLMYRHPEDKRYPLLLIHGKLATSMLSLALFLVHGRYLVYLANFVVDGLIGILIYLFSLNIKKSLR